MKPLIQAMRPTQWTKNAVVFAALLFGLGANEIAFTLMCVLEVTLAAILFCLVSSGIYLINDIRDIEKDQQHPVKKDRPIAAGRLPVSTALSTAVILLLGGTAAAWALAPRFAFVVVGYIALQLAYTFLLKEVALVDIFVIAAGFVLRAMAGAEVLAVPISPWLLLCTLLLALFLALCKRRHEKVVEENTSADTRPALKQYSRKLLDQLIAVVSAATIISYALYTLWPDTVEKFGTARLGFTVPFVIFGIFRYMDLVYRHELGGRPEKILLTDIPLLTDLVLYALTVGLILFVF